MNVQAKRMNVQAKTEPYRASLLADLPVPTRRKPEACGRLPANTTVVSCDSHWSITEDIFYERFPAHLKDRAPRVVRHADGVCDLYCNGQSSLPPGFHRVGAQFEGLPGSCTMEARIADLSAEGISNELVFGNAVLGLFGFADAEVREWTARIYNQYLSELQAQAPGKFYGVGIPNYWDMSKVRESIQEIKALGLKTYVIPNTPLSPKMEPLNYCSPDMEPLWAAVSEADLPLVFHIGEAFKVGPGSIGTNGMVNFGPFRKVMGELIFGGVFDRYPNIKVVFVEADINWIPGALQTATMVYDGFRNLLEPQLKHPPEYYWRNHCYATIMSDPVGLRLLDLIGADRVLWGGDYPHSEGVFGKSWTSMKEIMDVVSDDDARKMLGQTAIELFDL